MRCTTFTHSSRLEMKKINELQALVFRDLSATSAETGLAPPKRAKREKNFQNFSKFSGLLQILLSSFFSLLICHQIAHVSPKIQRNFAGFAKNVNDCRKSLFLKPLENFDDSIFLKLWWNWYRFIKSSLLLFCISDSSKLWHHHHTHFYFRIFL